MLIRKALLLDMDHDTKPDEEFWNLADSFIDLANEHCDTVRRSKVSATLLYAAARFNAFIVAAGTKTKGEFQNDKESAIAYFLERYQKMLRENLDDHERTYGKYMG